MKISRPSPALVVSITALVVACAGTATAASVLISNSSQVKAGAINGSDVKNSSLTGLDIKSGSLKGADLAPSAVSSQQIKDNSIGNDDLAASVRNTLRGTGLTASEAVRKAGPEGVEPNIPTRVGTIKQLEPGQYFITAKTTVTADTGDLGLGELLRQNKTGGAECFLEIAGDQDHARQAVVTPGSVSPATLNLQMTRTLDTPTDVALTCSVNDFKWRASDTSIVALKMQGTTRVDTSG